MPYHEKLMDHYENPRNVGALDKGDPFVGTGLVGAPACGDVMKLQIKVSKEGIITDAKFKTFGCGSAIASSSLVTEWVKGKSIDEAGSIKNTEIAKGCSGIEYYIEYADEKNKFDEVVEVQNVKILIDPKALMYLIGSIMDYVEDKFKTGFAFTNPNEKGSCGCGKSFSV
ncbi:unnamed protein product [Didymodactylos carnosus]|uniref:NIF system FeS cluster assembly NifU N-terminal domain-containing protein n=1 Tax=Didymodactylos carnosus TaxID=1234261 RepID=A0A813Q2U2_9BILA|nr:unnamed protein product [Didymodactylos carnosus]CAF3542051.1 unnamed protein product [Didymodactylos carnosus]